MVKFVEVDPATLDTSRLGRRGRVSYPLLKGFLESNIKLARVNHDDYDKNPTYLRSVLTSYIKGHNLPIKLMSIQGDLHLMRLDLDNKGNPIEGWEAKTATTEGAAGHLEHSEAKPLNAEEVEKRFASEKGNITA